MFDFLRTFLKLNDKVPTYTTTADSNNKTIECLRPWFFCVSVVVQFALWYNLFLNWYRIY